MHIRKEIKKSCQISKAKHMTMNSRANTISYTNYPQYFMQINEFQYMITFVTGFYFGFGKKDSG